MGGVGKHFPGHGSVAVDSHHALPVDGRSYDDIRLSDLVPFERLSASDLAGVMPAHVVFECLDARPAGFSGRWIEDVLRGELGFRGIVFSDDLDMAAAATGGDHVDRALAALDAGCDMVLVCNDWSGAVEVVEGLNIGPDPVRIARMARMHGRGAPSFERLASDSVYRRAVAEISSLVREPELDLGDDHLV
jgi:beta-N-acetylhexosaminidase